MNDFGWAVKMLKSERRIRRTAWNAWENVAMLDAYPSGIQVTESTKRVLGDDVGSPFLPYFVRRDWNGVLFVWQPSVEDILADDWIEVT